MQTLSSAQVLYLLEIMIADQINEFQCFNIFFVLSFKFYMQYLQRHLYKYMYIMVSLSITINTFKTFAY